MNLVADLEPYKLADVKGLVSVCLIIKKTFVLLEFFEAIIVGILFFHDFFLH